MKKWLISMLSVFVLCLCAPFAQAAVVSGGVEYLWWYNYERELSISADQGLSYAKLPGLAEEAARTGLSYDVAVYPLEDGGLRVEGRDRWGTERVYRRDYSAAQVAQALTAAEPTPKQVLCTNGEMTVACGEVHDMEKGDWSIANTHGWSKYTGHTQLFYSKDGVTWEVAEQPEDCHVTMAWWDGAAFYGGLEGRVTSADGIHWTETEEPKGNHLLSMSTELGPYRFEIVETDGYWDVYLTDRVSADTGVLLPHMGEAIHAKGVAPGTLRAWYGSNDTVILAAYDRYTKERLAASMNYPVSSLEWCLKNLRTQIRTIEPKASNGAVSLSQVEWRTPLGWERELVRNDGTGWTWMTDVPFHSQSVLYPYNGKAFMAREGKELYTSLDGQKWEELVRDELAYEAPESTSITTKYAIVWTGEKYISCRRIAEEGAGRWGRWGSWYAPTCTQVRFLDENFALLDLYDFGRQVEAVGYQNGVYYAKVSNSTEVDFAKFDGAAGSTLYHSVDGKTWTAGEETEVWGALTRPEREQWEVPKIAPEETPRSGGADGWAKLGSYRFYLMNDAVYVMDAAGGGVQLPGSEQAIRDAWLIPQFLTAKYDEKGNICLAVRDRSTPSMSATLNYSEEWLDGFLADNGYAGWLSPDGEAVCGGDSEGGPCLTYINVGHWKEPERMILRGIWGQGNHYFMGTQIQELQLLEDVPWGGYVELLPYTGKAFLLYDRESERYYWSEDGLAWSAAEGDWAKEAKAVVWAGNGYIAHQDGEGREKRLLLLDETFHLTGAYDFDFPIEAIGWWNGRAYVKVAGEEKSLIYASSDGRSWEKTDLLGEESVLYELR